MKNKDIKIINRSTTNELSFREKFFKLFKDCPIPDNELLPNLGLFIKRQDMARILFMHELYKKIINVNGMIMEFGVRWGQNLALFELFRGIYEPFNYNRKIIGFDTFGGFPSIDINDGKVNIDSTNNYSVTKNYEQYLEQILDYHEQESPIPHIKKYQLIKGDATIEIEKYLKVDTWFMRDANWSPDFPTSAEKALELYELEGGTEQFDGVIAVTPTLIESLLELTGEITVWGITFNSDNVVDVLEYQVEQGYYRQGISDADRKEVIGALADELMDRILSLPKERWVELWNVFEKDVSEKHILIYLENNDLQQLVLDQGWAGEIRDANGDYFMFIDANLASLKTDPGIKRTIKYHLDQDTAKVDINYHNEGVFNWKSTRYRTYARLCVPLGAELTEYSGAMENDKLHGGQPGEVETIQEKGKTCFGAFISIEPQERGTLSFTYKLPQNITNQINNGQYQLLVQKQAGTIAHDLEIELNFPKNIKYYQPLDKTGSVDNNTIIFKDDLRQDREYTITF